MEMRRHFQYFKHVMRHKWYVFIECCKLGIPWRGVVHDLSKFLPDEWTPCARVIYGDHHEKTEELVRDWNLGWLNHQRRNKHHWQYWISQTIDGEIILPMPVRYCREMLAHWRGRVARGRTVEWYMERREGLSKKLHPETRQWIEKQLGIEKPTDSATNPPTLLKTK